MLKLDILHNLPNFKLKARDELVINLFVTYFAFDLFLDLSFGETLFYFVFLRYL